MSAPPFRRILVANRGEIALRIIRACHALGIEAVLAVSEADRDSLPAQVADRTFCIGGASAADSYLDINRIITAALATGAEAVHPGYGFLAEKAELADACVTAGLVFVGPKAEHMRAMGNKLEARALAERSGVPNLPGSRRIQSVAEAVTAAKRIGFPVMLKAAAGGGGRGMKIVREAAEMERMFASAAGEARAAFGDDTLYLERYIASARHIEVQLIGDSFGNLIHLGERDCSLQRRHQKLVEEAPAPMLPNEVRESLRGVSLKLARSIGYLNAGTMEFVLDRDTGEFFFLEMNTRIQVEHPVTETITGIDLVEEQIRVAAGAPLRFKQSDVVFRGHAIECRITAEAPEQGFRPSPGLITTWKPPEGPNIRLDSHCYAGYLVPPYYDSLLGKLIVYGVDRDEAIARMRRALARFKVAGISTSVPFLETLIGHPEFAAGRMHTRLVEEFLAAPGAASPVAKA